MNPTPKVTLLTWTQHPLETVFSVWEASKAEGKLRTPAQVAAEVPKAELEKMFKAVIDQHIPIGEHVDFVFMLENISISWREQAVRHRIGTKASPERVGADIVMGEFPDLADSSWWSQSMRIQDMSQFVDNGAYRLPETIKEHADPVVAQRFHETMMLIQDAYKWMVEKGIPMEDAREVMPLGAQHRMSWKLNISALQHIVSKRGCWILQLGIWGPIIMGMIDELAKKVHPIFTELVTPPCIKGNAFVGCVYHEECRRRYTGDDKLPPCPLHLNHHHLPEHQRGMLPLILNQVDVPMKEDMVKRAEQYGTFWGRDPYSGGRLSDGK